MSIFVKEGLTFEPIKKLTVLSSSLETIFIKIKKSSLKLNMDLIIGVCFRPPSGDKKEFNIKIAGLLDGINHDTN